MRTHRLYCPQLPLPGQLFELSAEQANYVGRVLRLQPGDCINVFSGDGLEYRADVSKIKRKRIFLEIIHPVTNERESPLSIELGQVISRGDRMDYAIQKSVELGVHSVSPLFSTRCEVRLDPLRQEKRKQHWQQIVFSACEQSGRAFTPEVQTPAILETWLTSVDADVKLVLHPAGNLGNGPGPLPPAGELPDSVAVLIGPEGGFSAQEIQLCRTQGFRCLTLGPRILRTETAPVVALTFLQQRWGDLP